MISEDSISLRAVDKSRFRAEHVELVDFRNYAHTNVTLDPGFNVIHGANAQGKTNFLEALFLLSSTRLLRGMRDGEAVRDSCERAIIKATLGETGTELAITLQAGIRKRALINGMALPRAADLIGRMPCVCVSTADLPIVAGEPGDRRLFLDFELSQLYPAYLSKLSHYRRALDQRNALLRLANEQGVSDDVFDPWEVQMAESGAAMRASRNSFVRALSPVAYETQAALGGGELIELEYIQKDEAQDESTLLEAFSKSRARDTARGTTSIGPHRDDVLIKVGGREARLFGSQGQQRTAMISIKLASLTLSSEVLGAPALLLLDDIFSDLDENRRARLTEWIPDHAGQTILTCTEAKLAGNAILDRAKLFTCEAGKLNES